MRGIDILLIEDSYGDIRLTEEALKSSAFDSRLHVVSDASKAMGYLRREDQFSEATRPDLILLDLNMPKRDGRDILTELKADQDLKSIPVVVLSTSNSDEDRKISYDLFANSFVTKPANLDEFFKIVRSIEEYWFIVAKTP